MRTINKTLVLFTALTLSTAVTAQTPKQTQPGSFPRNAQHVNLDITVTDKDGQFVTGLKSSDFDVSVDKKPAHIISIGPADSPVSVGILLDSSGSVGGKSGKQITKNFDVLRDGLRRFIASSNPANDYFLMGFNVQPQLLADWTSDSASMLETFDDLQVAGNTAFFDACYLAVDKLRHARHARRALIVMSDGQDNLSHYNFNDLRESLRETSVPLYAIFFSNSLVFGSHLFVEGSTILERLSALSGGSFFSNSTGTPLKAKEANAFFETIALELRHQYAITLVADDTLSSKKWHKVEVKLKLPTGAPREMKGLSVRTREGFYAN